MKRRFDIKKRTGNKNFLSLMLMTGLIVILLFAYSSQFPKMQEQFDENYTNIDITFFDHSLQDLNPSGKVIIDGQLVYQVDSISMSMFQDSEVNLKKGKHIIEISTIDGQYKVIDTIVVVKYPMKYKLWIRFNYNPPVEEYKKLVVNRVYNKRIREKDLSEEQQQRVLQQVTEKIDQEFDNELNYKQ